MNLLIPILLRAETRSEQEWDDDIRVLLDRAVDSAERGRPGDIGLATYPAEVWYEFTYGAEELSQRPEDVLAIAGLEIRQQRVVAPEPAEPGMYVAFWTATSDDTLGVTVADVGDLVEDTRVEDERNFGWLAAGFDEVMTRLTDISKTYACENRKSTLACVDRDCAWGGCVNYSWIDPDSGIRLYGCVCATR
jgi:hypothetical protein